MNLASKARASTLLQLTALLFTGACTPASAKTEEADANRVAMSRWLSKSTATPLLVGIYDTQLIGVARSKDTLFVSSTPQAKSTETAKLVVQIDPQEALNLDTESPPPKAPNGVLSAAISMGIAADFTGPLTVTVVGQEEIQTLASFSIWWERTP